MTAPPRRELLPCPFCGGAASMHTPHGQVWVIQCIGHARIEGDHDDAIEAWNTRASSPELAAARKAEREKLREPTDDMLRKGVRAFQTARQGSDNLADWRSFYRETFDAAIRALED